MSLADVKPSDALDEGDLTDGASSGAGGEDAAGDDAVSSAGSWDPKEMLLSTSPDLAPRDVQARTGVDLWAAHFFIMVRKMISAVAPSTGDETGLPAIGNGLLAAYYRFLTPGDSDGGNDGDDDSGSEESFREDDGDDLEDHPNYRDPAAGGGAPA